MGVRGQNHQIDNIELNVADIARSRKFYGTAFGWTFTDYGPVYCEFTDGRLTGGLTTSGPVKAGGPLVILYADDLAATQKRIEGAGGKIAKPVYEFPGGRRFHFTDPDGYEFGGLVDKQIDLGLMIEIIDQLGFLLLGGLFVWAAGLHFLTFKDVSSMLAGRGFPAPALMLAAGSLVELVGGLCLILGVGRPYAAAALIVFTIAATVMMLDFWRYSGVERLNLRSAFTANLAIIGGLLLAATADLR